ELLRRLASLAADRGFDTPEIQDLMENHEPVLVPESPEITPHLVTTGTGVSLPRRYGLPRADTYERDRHSLFLQNLCEERDEIGEGVTSFFVLKYWFIAFFDPPRWSSAASVEGRGIVTPSPQVSREDVNMNDAGPGPSGEQALGLGQESPRVSTEAADA